MVSSNFTTQLATPKSLSIATLVIYLVLLQPLSFVFYHHGLRNWLAWLPLQSLCVVRIVGCGLQIHADNTNTFSSAALILNSIGLAPLLLAAQGILHEARAARNPNLRRKLEWFLVIQFHSIVIVGVVLVIIGILKLTGTHPQESDTKFSKIGVVIIFICWLVLVMWTAISFRSSQYDRRSPAHHSGMKLLYGIVCALPFIGFRESDAVLSNFITSKTFLDSLAVKVCLSVVPEMIATTIFIIVGYATRNIRAELRGRSKEELNIRQPAGSGSEGQKVELLLRRENEQAE